MTENITESVKQRLKNVARRENKSFNSILLLYMQERLLYRLSISNFNNRFVLKGGLFLYSISNFKSRPTKDIDFLGSNISNDLNVIKEIFRNLCSIEFNEDGMFYDKDTVSVKVIKEGSHYEGLE